MTFSRSSWALRSSVLALSLLALASCNDDDDDDGGGGGSSDSDSRVDIGMTDAPVDQLAAFRAQLDEIVLLRDDGTETNDLLANPLEVEFLGLDGTYAWVASADVDTGTFTGARVRFVPGSVEALLKSGASVGVNYGDEPLVVSFPSPVALAESGYRSIAIDLDLGESLVTELSQSSPPIEKDDAAAPLVGDSTPPTLVFLPEGSVFSDDGSEPQALDEVEARFLQIGTAADRLLVHAFGGDDAELDLGEIEVAIAAPALLLSQEGQTLTQDEFFAELVPDLSMLEIHGTLVGGEIQASLIEVEDLDGDGTDGFPIKFEGLVLAHEMNVGFEFLILEIEEGAEIVEPELEELGNPTSLHAVYDASTLFLAEDGGGILGPDALVPGQRIKVKFAQFLSSPFHAGRVDFMDLDPRVAAIVTDIAGLPAQLVVHVEAGEPVLGHQVETSETDVLVDLDGASIVVDTQGEPVLAPGQLLVGTRLQVEGPIAGTATEPTIDAKTLKVRPGRLEGARVTSIDRVGMGFTTDGGVIVEPFASGIEAGPLRVNFDPSAIVEDEATSIEAFFDLYESLLAPNMLFVEIEGIGTETPDTILAFEVEARVE